MADVPALSQDQKSWLARGVTAVGVIAVLAIAWPAVWVAFLSSLGMVGIGIMFLVGAALIQALPMLGQKWENKILNLRMAEARANPIAQIQNNVIRKTQQLKSFKDGLTVIGTQITSLGDSLKAQAKADPGDDLTDQWTALRKMEAFYEKKKGKYQAAVISLEEYKTAVERAKFKYGFGNAAKGIAAAMNEADAEALMQNMLSDEAFSAVNDRYNSAFAELDIESLELTSTKQLEFGKGLTLDMQTIEIPQVQPIPLRRA